MATEHEDVSHGCTTGYKDVSQGYSKVQDVPVAHLLVANKKPFPGSQLSS